MADTSLREEIARNFQVYRGWTSDADAKEDLAHRVDEIESLIQKREREALSQVRRPTREDAVAFAKSVAESDTGLGGFLSMHGNGMGVESFASLLFRFANPSEWLTSLTKDSKNGEKDHE